MLEPKVSMVYGIMLLKRSFTHNNDEKRYVGQFTINNYSQWVAGPRDDPDVAHLHEGAHEGVGRHEAGHERRRMPLPDWISRK